MAGALTAAIASIFSGSAVTADPYYEYTTLLLPGSGTNGAQNNTFLDGSTNNFTITRNGNTTQGTFSPFSQTGWGNYFNGSSYLSLTSDAAFSVGTGQVTIEAWVYCTSLTQPYQGIISGRSNTTNYPGLGLVIDNSKVSFTIMNNADALIDSDNIPINQWVHIVGVRNASNNTALFVNGVRKAYSASNTANGTTTTMGLGRFYVTDANYYFSGYISNARIVKGSAAYDPTSSTITVPTAPLTAISGTSLLTCQSNRFRDASTNNFTITVNGNTSVVAFSPFNPTASWSAATYGGSGYFDGSGDYLSVASNTAFAFGTGEWTIECWVYASAIDVASVFFSCGTNGTQLGTNASGNLAIAQTGVAFEVNSSTTLPLNQWNHVAAVRNSSNSSSIFLNGTRIVNGTLTTNYSSSGTAYVNYNPNNVGNDFTGYMSGLRVVKGTAVYDPTQTTITVPTAPLTAITNTSLLLNYTNAGIYDATSKNDLETVGDAQISNTTAKWGSTSIKFDGTGDWLLIPDQPPQRIGTGKFTIELWVYRNSSGTYGLVGKGTGTTGWLVSLNSSNQVVFTYGSSTITSTGTVSATTWTHIAVVREGTSTNQTKIYINGTNDGTGTVSTDFNQTNSMYIGADRTGGSAANAYVQDVRITNDARYTANFTAPTAAFPTL